MIRVTILRSCIAIATLTCAMTCAIAPLSPARAEQVALKADLKASDEVPPNDSKGSGTVSITFDSTTKTLNWKGSVSGLTGAATAAHFHGPAEPGKNAGVMVAIPNPGSGQIEGTASLSDAQAADLMAGRVYVNVHTAAHPGGELRGQVVK